MSQRKIIGPFNRVEGDLEIQLEIAHGQVQAAWVNSPLYRGFEQILLGKPPQDALVIAPRICGICSLSQSVAAAYALADAQQLEMPQNGQLAINLMLACENLADHLSHFYLFFMPDFARPVYTEQPWHAHIEAQFQAQRGSVAAQAMQARAAFLHCMGLLAGRWPHSLGIQSGGSSRAVTAAEKIQLLNILGQFRQFLEQHTFGVPLESFAALSNSHDLHAYQQTHAQSHAAQFLMLANALKLEQLGRASDQFMSYGAYRLAESHAFSAGVWQQGLKPLNTEAIREDVSHAWLHRAEPAHPRQGQTLPDADIEQAYSWCKAPRLDGRVMETGALARQQVQGHPLIRALVAETGGNVQNRVVARLLEFALVLPMMENWARALQPTQPFCVTAKLPKQAQGVGLVEAARGSLGHWLDIHNGKIANYQIIAPTTWNFSPRDAQQQAGALEQALVGAPAQENERTPIAVQHIVRSFDPCMVCTVH